MAANGQLQVGKACLTGGGNMPCRHVVHVHGPRWGTPDAQDKLAEAVKSALDCCDSAGLKKWTRSLSLSLS